MRKRRVLAFILMITMLFGNTMSVSASPSVSGNAIDIVTEEEESSVETTDSESEEESVETENSTGEESSAEEGSVEESSVEEVTSVESTEEGTTEEETTTEEMTTEETTTEEMTTEEETILAEVNLSEDENVCKEIYFATIGADGTLTRVDSLTMRPDEYVELQLVLVKPDGSLETGIVSDGDEWTYNDDDIYWDIYMQPEEEEEVDASILELLPVEFGVENKAGITAHDTVQAGENYYLTVWRNIRIESMAGSYYAQLPITIVEAAENDTYTKVENGRNDIYLTADLLSEGIRSDMVAREKTGVYYIKESVYEEWQENGGTDAVYDFNREREGMKPDEGDYLFWQNFDPEKIMSILEDQWVFQQTFFNGDPWWRIDSKQVYFSTAAQEQAVTEKIDYILKNPAGGLYSVYSQYYKEDGNYTNAERKAIADACCNYVHQKTKYIGTPVPRYHSAHSAIINGTGTCQAYALYLTRLLREFGIATKILTGTDVNYHTYNIVQIDAENDLWYYYDATGGINYKTESEFSRTNYQGLFLEDPLFIENYLSKIVGSAYSPQIYLYSGESVVGKYFTIESAVDGLIEHNSVEENADSHYRIVLQGDADIGDGNLILPETVAYCELDLNGHTITVQDGAHLALDKVCNGTFYVKIAPYMHFNVYVPENDAEETIYENLVFDFEKANPGFFVESEKYSYAFQEPEEEIEPELDAAVVLKNVTIGNNSATDFYGAVHMDEASSITTRWLALSNSEREDYAHLLGTIHTDYVNAIVGKFDIGNLTCTGETNIDTQSVLNIRGSVSLGNVSLWDRGYGVYMNIIQILDDKGNVSSTGNVTFNGSIYCSEGCNEENCHIIFHKKQISVDDNGMESEPVSVKFNSGETIAVVKKDTSAIPTEYFTLANADADESIIRNGTKLIAARITVKVSYTDEKGIETTKEYISLENAVANLNVDFGGKKGSYTVTITDDCKLNANVTFPAFVTKLDLKALGKDGLAASHILDLNGYSVSTGAVVDLHNNLLLANTSQTAAKFTTTAKNSTDGFVFKVMGDTSTANAVHLSNLTLTASNGTVLFESIDTENFHNADVAVTAKEVVVNSGKWKLGTLSVTNFANNAITDVVKLNNVQNVDNKTGSVLIVDSYTQKTNGITNLESASKLLVKSSAKIYNTVIGGKEGMGTEPVYVYRMSDYADNNGAKETASCTVAFEGKVTSTNEALQIAFGVLDPEADVLTGNGTLSDLKPRTKLFTTSIKTFPVELFTVNQNGESPVYTDVYQQDGNIYVGREWITIYAKQVNGNETELKRFIRWTDAATYLDTLSNTQMEYVVEISEDVELFTALTLPKKVNGITFRGEDTDSSDNNDRITLTYIGDIRVSGDTTFENINLVAKKYDSRAKEYVDYQSAVTLNGMTLTLKNSSADFASIAGNNKSKLVLESSQAEVIKAVTSLGCLDMIGTAGLSDTGAAAVDTTLSADNVTVTDTLTMQSAKIDCVNKIALKTVVTKDAYNVLSYGGNTNKNGLTITGNVSADTVDGMTDENVKINGTEETATVRKNAINLQIKSMESAGYTEGALLCTAEKAGAGWFVVGSDWETVGDVTTRVISHGTYKNGKLIYCGEIEENVKLYSSSNEEGTYAYESGFATLQEALTEIDKLAVSDAYYRIELVSAQENVVTFNSKAPTFPSKTKGITIAGDSKLASPYLYFKGNLTLKSDTTFEDMVFVPQTKSSISLGNHELRLENCAVDISRSGVEFGGITGSGVNGTSALILDDTVLAVAGNVNNVANLVFAGEAAAEPSSSIATFSLLRSTPAYPKLTADGTVNVGTVMLEKDGFITGLATVARSKGMVTKITPQITINKDVSSEEGHTLYLDLQEKVSNEFISLDFNNAEMTDILKAGVPLAKTLYVTYPNIKAAQRNNEASLVKSGSYLTYFADGYGVVLSYEGIVTAEDGTISQQTIQIPCRTFADAVTEINNQKTKRDYTIILQPAITEISGADQSGAVPKALTMPNRNYVDTLTIQAPEDNDAVKLGFINNITLTCNVVLENVQFVQMMKVGSVYQTSDFAKENFPGALTFNTAGFGVTIKGENTFNTPLVMNGSNKTILTFGENGTITTLTNSYDGQNNSSVVENVIYGSLTNLDTVNVNDCNLTLRAYKSSPTVTSYTESKNKITTVNVFGTVEENNGVNETTGKIKVESAASKGEFTATNYNSDNGNLLVDGKVNLKNVTLEGDYTASIHADTNFDITGNLIARSNYALLETRLKGAGKEPYLNISGTVVRVGDTQAIEVVVYPETTAINTETPVNMKNTSKGKEQLLAAKSAQSADFRLSDGNYSGGEYSAEEPVNAEGYMLLKEGGKIYVYNGEKVGLAVYKGDYTGADTTDLLGFYPSFKEATADVDALKDKTQNYTYVLTKENGTLDKPVSVTLPTQAESVTITRLASGSGNETIYVSGNISLKCDTIFENIEFAPVSRSVGTAFSIAAGGYDVALQNVSVSNESDKMALKDISGNGKQTVTLASSDLEMTGSITNATEMIVSEDTLIKGNVKTATLSLCNSESVEKVGVTLTVNGTVNVDTLKNNGTTQNTLEYSRNTSSKNSNLTINKDIVNETEENIVVLKQQDAYSLTALTKTGEKVTLANASKALALPKASTDSFVLSATCVAADGQTVSLGGSNEGYTVVKADKGVYIADNTLKNDIVQLERTGYGTEDEIIVESVTDCLDYSQAVNEINTLADMQSSYEIRFMTAGSDAKGGKPIDTNVKDANPYGTFALPKSNAKKALVVTGIENGTTIVPFSGNVSGQGMVTLQNLVLNPVKSGTDSTPADTKISITSDKTATQLTLQNVSTNEVSAADAKSTGFIAGISGTRNKTDVSFVNCEGLIVKSGITNVNTISLKGTNLLSDGAVTVNTVELVNGSSWDSLGKMTVSDVYVEVSENGVSTSYIGTKQDRNGNPQFVVNSDVTDDALLCKVYTTDATIADGTAIFAGTCEKELTDYENKPLVSAKKASADKFRAYAFKDVTDGSIVSYKDGVYVKNGNLAAMQVKLIEHNQSAEGAVLSTSYAATFEDAVTTINNKADTTAYYEIRFIQQPDSEEESVVIRTTKKGTAYGAITLPSKAAGVTISGYTPENSIEAAPCTVIKYTGTLKASCDVTFENILLTEGKVDAKEPDGFAENGTITPAPANNVTISFKENVYTNQNSVTESINAENGLVVNAINAGKGHLVFNGNAVSTEKTINIGSLTLLDGASLNAVGKVTIPDLIADANEANSLSSEAAISIGNIKNQNTEEGAEIANVRICSDFTKNTKEGAFGNSQLTISGLVEDVNVKLNYRRYILSSKTYVEMEQADFEKLLMQTDGKPDGYKKLATVPKASLDWITVAKAKDSNVLYKAYDHNSPETQMYLYKYDTGLYLTDLKPLVLVNGYKATEDGENVYTNENLCYQAEFLSWEQAVKEIEKINDKTRYYELRLLDTIGYNKEDQKVDSPIGTVTMPSKAAEVFITSESGEENGIFFTGTNVALKCQVRMENVGFTCVKKYGTGANIYYQPVTYTMNIGNFKLFQKDMVNAFCNEETVPYTVSGSATGIFELISDSTGSRQFAAIKGMDKLIVDYTTEQAVGYENLTVDCSGDVSVKNLIVTNSTVEAKNMTVSTLATLDEAALWAGTSAANDGKMTLKDIVLGDNGNALRAEQNRNGATQLTINGTVTAAADATDDALDEGTLEIALYYNNYQKGSNYQKYAQLYNDMILCVAQKAASSLFVPVYTETAQNGDITQNGMGIKTDTHGIYKSGKNICYGTSEKTREVQLSIGDSGMTTYFASFEEAVKEIDSLSLYKDPTAKTKEYEDYTIALLSDVEIGNAKKNNSFSALSLPSKAKELTIDGNGNDLSFNGNVSVRCNTKFSDINLYPIKNVKGQGVKTAVNYAIGNYTLELDHTVSRDESGMSLIGNVSGSSKSGIFKLAAGAEGQRNDISINQLTGLREVVLEEYTQLHVDKNCNVYQLTFHNGTLRETSTGESETQEVPEVTENGLPVLSVDGALTATLVNAENAGAANGVYGIIRKPISSKMTINGLYEDRDKDKVKEYYSLSFPGDVSDGCIRVEVVGAPCPAGTLILTGKYLNWNEVGDNIKVVSKTNELSTGSECITYSKGTNLYIGEKVE